MKHYSNNWITYAELTTAPKDMTESLALQSLTEATGDRGHKVYELSNHLGNVLATVSDKKLGQILGGSIVASYYEAQVQTASDYYPFGWQIPSRKVTNGKKYTYGFNGQLEDEEWNGGQSVNFLFRVHDPRVGRFLSVDPLAPYYPWNTPYGFAENDVIRSIDLEGAEAEQKTRRPSCGAGTTQSSGTSSTQKGGSNAPGSHKSGEGMKQNGGRNSSSSAGSHRSGAGMKQGGRGNTSTSAGKQQMRQRSMARGMDKYVQGSKVVPNPYVQAFRWGWNIGKGIKDLYLIQQELFAEPEPNNGLEIVIPVPSTENNTEADTEEDEDDREKKIIGLGIDEDLGKLPSYAITYTWGKWYTAKLTSISWPQANLSMYDYMLHFEESAANADGIIFEVTNFDPLYDYNSNPKNYRKRDLKQYTLQEFNHIYNTPHLLNKTKFIKNGQRVVWTGTDFRPYMH